MKRSFVQIILAGMAMTGSAADFAPLWEHDSASFPGADWRAAGPLLEQRTAADGKQVQQALPRPFYSQLDDRDSGQFYRDVLWPLGFSRRAANDGYEFFALFLHTDSDFKDPRSRERWWLIPIFFHGIDDAGQTYSALFPFYGRISNLAGFQSVRFVLFPLYLSTGKQEVRSTTYLWPFFSRTTGEQVEKKRYFPFYGSSRNPHELRRFYLWPFVHTVIQFPKENGRSGSGWFVLPFYGKSRQVDAAGKIVQSSWTCLWPFFSGEKSADKERLYGPWPFLRSETVTTRTGPATQNHLWPFYGHSQSAEKVADYRFWPFRQSWSAESPDGRANFSAWLPFYWSMRVQAKENAPFIYRHIWPLAKYENDGSRSRLKLLALWPMRYFPAIERNYAPFWTLYTRECTGDQIRQEALWGWWKYGNSATGTDHFSLFPLMEYDHSGKTVEWSVGKGLLGRESEGSRSRWRLLWFMSFAMENLFSRQL